MVWWDGGVSPFVSSDLLGNAFPRPSLWFYYNTVNRILQDGVLYKVNRRFLVNIILLTVWDLCYNIAIMGG